MFQAINYVDVKKLWMKFIPQKMNIVDDPKQQSRNI